MSRTVPAVLASLVFAGAAFAAPSPTKSSVTLHQPTEVAGTVLDAGTYRLEVDAGHARFVKGKRVVAESPVKVGLERAFYAGNAVHSRTVGGQERLTKIVLADSGLSIEFPFERAAATGGAAAK